MPSSIAKKGSLFALAAGLLWVSNLAFPSRLVIAFKPPEVCDCGKICMMHRSCSIPWCTGDFFRDAAASMPDEARSVRSPKHFRDLETEQLNAQSGTVSIEEDGL